MRSKFAVFAALLLLARGAHATEPAHDDDVRATAPSEEAKEHFDTALEQYRAGRYKSAISELEQAYGLDPTGKDLVYNLAMVYEKLGRLDAAIHYLKRYAELETNAAELERTRASIVRLQGAQSELGPASAPPPGKNPPCERAPAAASNTSGKLDQWVIVAGGASIAAAIVGTVFGVRALVLQPSDDDATGRSTSIDTLRDRAARARDSARVADVAFAVSIVSGSAAALLYFGRSPDQRDTTASVRLAGQF